MIACHLWFMINGSWLMVEADGKQAEAHYPENYTRDVGRDECGTGRESSSAVYGQEDIENNLVVLLICFCGTMGTTQVGGL